MSDETSSPKKAVVLLVEDNDNDVELTRLGFESAKLSLELDRVEDGVECMAYLRKQSPYENANTPDLLLLDLNMPRMGGREVLMEMALDPVLRLIPVVILTTSSQESEILRLYDLKCSSYIVKPLDFLQFQKIIQTIAEYWFTVVVLPKADTDDRSTE